MVVLIVTKLRNYVRNFPLNLKNKFCLTLKINEKNVKKTICTLVNNVSMIPNHVPRWYIRGTTSAFIIFILRQNPLTVPFLLMLC